MPAKLKKLAHHALILEDSPDIATELVAICATQGHTATVVTTLDELEAALEAGGYCYILADMAVPPRAGMKPSPLSGRTAIKWGRARHPERNAAGHHTLAILAVTTHWHDADFVSEMFELGISGLIGKPIDEQHQKVADKILAALERAERSDHAACIGREQVARSVGGSLVLGVPGTVVNKQAAIEIGGLVIGLRRQLFTTTVRLIDVRIRKGLDYEKRVDLKIAAAADVPSRINTDCLNAGLVLPEAFMIVQTDGETGCRLNPAIELGEVNWQWLTGHGDKDIVKIAENRLARAARDAALGRTNPGAR